MSWKTKTGLSSITLVALSVLFYLLLTSWMPFQAMCLYGFDRQTPDRYGWTPLHSEAAVGRMAMLDYLIGKGGDLDSRNLRGETAYNLALLYGRLEAAELLSRSGADTSAPVFPVLTGPCMGQLSPGDTPVMFLPGVISGHNRAHSAVVFSPDGTEAYWSEGVGVTFGLLSFGGVGAVPCMRMVDGQWSYPAVTRMWADPSLSPDGRRIFYYSFEPVSEGAGWDKENYWCMDRTDSGWSEPKPVGDAVNALPIHWQCSTDRDGNLFFGLFADSMYVSPLVGGEYGTPVSLREYCRNETIVGCSPYVAPDGDYLLFSCDGDLYVSFCSAHGDWTDRISLGDEINGRVSAVNARVTPDGKYIFFQGTGDDDDDWGIYWVSAGVIDRLKEAHSR